MRALIAGVSGFIGSALTRKLVEEGHEVHAVVRRDPGDGQAAFDLGARRIDVSRLPGGSLTGVDVVFCLVGAPLVPRRWGLERRESLRASRIQTTDVLARAIATAQDAPPVFISMSATGYYGSRGDEILDEGSTAGSGFLAELCRAWEAATAPARDRGVRVAYVRTGIVLGPGGGALATLRPLFSHGLGARLGSGRQWTSWISLDDAVTGLQTVAANADLAGAVNLVSPNPVRNDTFTEALAASVGRPSRLVVPRAVLVGAVGKRVADEFVLASQRVVPRRLQGVGMTWAHPDIDRALAASEPSASAVIG